MNPDGLEEWGSYISSLSGEALWSKAVAANSLSFVRGLIEEGYVPEHAVNVLLMFAVQLEKDGQAVPTDMQDQYLSYPALLACVGG